MAKAKKKAVSKKKKGRPPEITKEKVDKMVESIRMGSYIETAANSAGISKDTLYRWLRKGARKEGAEYEHFSDAVYKAMSDSELRDVAIIDKAAQNGDWKASAWRLERKHQAKWGYKQSVKAIPGDGSEFKDEQDSIHDKLVNLIEEKEKE